MDKTQVRRSPEQEPGDDRNSPTSPCSTSSEDGESSGTPIPTQAGGGSRQDRPIPEAIAETWEDIAEAGEDPDQLDNDLLNQMYKNAQNQALKDTEENTNETVEVQVIRVREDELPITQKNGAYRNTLFAAKDGTPFMQVTSGYNYNGDGTASVRIYITDEIESLEAKARLVVT